MLIQQQIKESFQLLADRQKLSAIHDELMQAGLLWQPEPQVQPQPKPIPELVPQREKVTPSGGTRSVGWAYYAMAACLVLAMSLGWYFLRAKKETDTDDKMVKDQKSSQHTQPTDTTKANTKPKTSPQSLPAPSPTVETSQPQLANQNEKLFDTYFTPSIRRQLPNSANDERLTAPRPRSESFQRIAQDTTDILSGIRLLRRGNARQAISTLEPTTSCVLPEWQANARWFLALAYLKNNQKDKAREQLQALLNGQSDLYQQEAQALTNALK